MNSTGDCLIENNELDKLINFVCHKYGYDFSDYAFDSFKRRVTRIMLKYHISDFYNLRFLLQESDTFFNDFLEDITVNVTDMFRDPDFFKVLRRDVIPQLSTFPLIRIWHAGCSTGEEVYSMAILLKEAGLLERSLLYATDINQGVLNMASDFKVPIETMNKYSENYIHAGGISDFSDYYTIDNNKAVFKEEFRRRMVFSPHNLVLDRSFNEFNLILCRNVLIYFNRDLQNRVIQLFSESVSPFGFLALGNKESIEFTSSVNDFEVLNKHQKVWKKINNGRK